MQSGGTLPTKQVKVVAHQPMGTTKVVHATGTESEGQELGTLASRGAKGPEQLPAVRLVLPVDGHLPPWTAGSRWRAVVPTEVGDVAPEQILAAARPSPIGARSERVLVAAAADPELDQLDALIAEPGDLQLPAALVLALRAVDADPLRAEAALSLVRESGKEPWNHKLLRKHLPDLLVCVVLAPGVRACLTVSADALALLHAELLATCGRMIETVRVLEGIAMSGVVGVALAAAYLTTGRSNSVVALTDQLNNIDDFSALGFVARAVALKTVGRNAEALEALDRALAWPDRHPGVIAAALEERAAMLGEAGDQLAARADLERLRTIDSSVATDEVAADGAEPDRPVEEVDTAEAACFEARSRVRRQLRGTGIPGTFGGRHHNTYRAEVEEILATDHLQTAESLLLGLMDAVEDEAEETGQGIEATYYLTLADLFAAHDLDAARQAVLERYEAALQRYGSTEEPRRVDEQPADAEPPAPADAEPPAPADAGPPAAADGDELIALGAPSGADGAPDEADAAPPAAVDDGEAATLAPSELSV